MDCEGVVKGLIDDNCVFDSVIYWMHINWYILASRRVSLLAVRTLRIVRGL